MNILSKLSNAELENSMGVHVRNERMSLDQIYAHINEVYRRELHLDSKYGSMKAYLVGRWKYSEREAYRKIDGARLLKDVPSLTNEIRDGNINADVIGEVSRAVKEKERATGEKLTAAMKTELVKMVSGKSVNESQRELAQTLDIKVKEFESKRFQKDKSVRLELTLSEEIYANLKLCQDHASHKLQQEKLPNTVESMIKLLTDYYLKGHKLDLNNLSKINKTEIDTSDDISNLASDTEGRRNAQSIQPKAPKKFNKSVTPKTKRMVFARDKCCQYTNPETGEICGETRFAQVDHKTPQWAGGGHELDNLQQLCANHNQRKYRKEAQLSWL
jgi:HNH endonuclease.